MIFWSETGLEGRLLRDAAIDSAAGEYTHTAERVFLADDIQMW